MDMFATFIDILKEYLETHDLSMNTFAQNVGVEQTAVGYWLIGKNFPSLESVIRVADYLDCAIDYLFGLTQNPAYPKASVRTSLTHRLKELLKPNKNQVALCTGIHPSLLSKWERGICTPKIESLIKLANYFNCSLDYLVGRSDAK